MEKKTETRLNKVIVSLTAIKASGMKMEWKPEQAGELRDALIAIRASVEAADKIRLENEKLRNELHKLRDAKGAQWFWAKLGQGFFFSVILTALVYGFQ